MSNGRHVVLLVHGIRTRAEWAQRTAHVLESVPGMQVALVGYGFFDTIRFLLPIRAIRDAPVQRVTTQVRTVLDSAGGKRTRLSIVAHSFGTYIIAQVLQREPDIRVHRLIFAGSIVPETF